MADKNDQKSLATLFKAAADPLRLDILCALSRASYGVLELSEAFDVKQSGMSHHLKVLATSGLVSTRREGNSIFYRRATIGANDPHKKVKNALFDQIEQLALEASIHNRFEQIHRDRSAASRTFFSENANKFKAQQELIASFDVYGPSVKELLENTPMPGHEAALEVGPGEGELLPELDKRFDYVLALDNSPIMLEKSAARIDEQALARVELNCSDTGALSAMPQKFDCSVINMVLHHTPAPQQMLFEVAEALKPDGALLLTELCDHQQDWVREACGDLWLGFEPEELVDWAEQAELRLNQTSYLALRNGFQIQIQQFFKH